MTLASIGSNSTPTTLPVSTPASQRHGGRRGFGYYDFVQHDIG